MTFAVRLALTLAMVSTLSACTEGRLIGFSLNLLGMVSGLSVTIGDQELTIDWAPTSTASGYTIMYGTSPGVYSGTAGPVTTGPFTLTGLTNNTTYYFIVVATTPLGDQRSNEMTATPVPFVPNLVLSPLTHDFGTGLTGVATSAQTFTISNTGIAPATTCSLPILTGANAADFSIFSDSCGTADLASLDSCEIEVTATPSAQGVRTATLSRSCAVGGTVTTTVNAIQITGVAPTLAWGTLTHGFGNILVGSSSGVQTFVLNNTGTASATTCSAPILTGANANQFTLSGNTCGATITAGGSCQVDIAGSPTSLGAKTATLEMTCSVGGTPSTTTNGITVTGVAPALAWNQATYGFGSVLVGGSSSPRTFVLNNTGTAAATTCSAPILTGANANQFSLSGNTCGATVAAAGSCQVDVTASPTSTGAKTATLEMTCSVGGTPSTTTNGITVTGAVPGLSWDQATHAFGNQLINTSSATSTFIITNTGGVNATGCTAPVLSGTNPGHFTLSGNTCGATINAGASCQVDVAASPTTVGVKAATLELNCTVGGLTSTTANGLTTTGVTPSLALTPVTYDFGSILSGSNSTAHTFTVNNSGTAAATGCGALTLTGANAAQFSLSGNTCGATVAAAGSCQVDVTASPATNGLKTATLEMTCTVGGTVTTTANAIQVTGISPGLAWSPLSNVFGNIQTGTSSSGVTFTLSNSGGAAATGCSAPVLSGANPGEFLLSGDTCLTNNLNTASSCQVVVTAHPNTTGTKTATLERTCTVGGTISTTTNAITVVGAVPTLAWDQSSYAFGNQLINTSSTAHTFTLNNTGGVAATGCSAPVLSGTNAAQFSLSGNTCAATVAAGGSCQVNVTGTPTSTGTKTATLEMTCTVGGTPSTTANAITIVGTNPSLAWNSSTRAFGNQQIGTSSATYTFIITNSGTAAATGCSAPVLSGANANQFTLSGNTCGATIAASGGSCQVDVAASPTTTGAKTATLDLACTVPGTTSTTTNGITTTGVNPSLAWNSSTRAFGNQQIGASSATYTFIITNSGSGPATGCSAPVLSGANANQFTLSGNTCGATIAASGGSCQVDVAASPTTTGAKTATLDLACTVPGTTSTNTNGITATGVNPSLAWNSNTRAFGNQAVGTSSATYTFIITNSGSGAATGCSAPVLSGANANQFTLSGNTCGATIAASGGSCQVDVAASPTTAGAKTATLDLACTVPGTTSTTTNGITTTGTEPVLAWSSTTTNDFGNVTVNQYTTHIVATFQNTGTATATGCSAPTLAGANPAHFSIVSDGCSTSDLGTSSSCQVWVIAAPTSTGAKTAHLTRTCTLGGTVTTPVNGYVTNGVTPTVAWTELTYDYGNVEIGNAATTHTFTLSNTGLGNLYGCGLPTLSGTHSAEYVLNANTCGTILNGSTSCTVNATPTPLALGARTATISITCSNGSATTTANGLTVTGTNSTPNLAWTGWTSADFGSQSVGGPSGTITATLHNSGAGPATGCSAPVFAGANPGDFEITSDGCATADLAASSTCNVSMRARPTAGGTRTAHLNRTCTVGGTVTTLTNGFTVNGLVAAQLAFTTQPPATGNAGAALANIQVSVQSSGGVLIDNATNPVTIEPFSDAACTTPITGFTYGPVAPVSASIGVATIGASYFTKAGPTYLKATSGALTSACSSLMTISPLGASRYSFTVQPSSTSYLGSYLSTPPTVAVSDTYGNPVPVAGNNVNLSLYTDATCTTSSANTLIAAPTPTNASGLAAFGSVTINGAVTGNVYLRASGTLTVGCSSAINLSMPYHVVNNSAQAANMISNRFHFGFVRVGKSSFEHDFYFQNESDSITVTSCSAPVLSDTTNFTVITDNCGSNDILPGQQCRYKVKANPTSTGTKNATITRSCTGGNIAIDLTAVGGSEAPVEVELADQSGCILTDAGRVKCWGIGTLGQVGDGGLQNRYAPSDIGLTDIVQISTGGYQTCAINSTGSLYCWGYNFAGQVGDGTVTMRGSPVLIGTGFASVSAGFNHTCAVHSDTTVSCWGTNSSNQLGDGTAIERHSPTPISSAALTGVVMLASGMNVTCALLIDTTVKCWGGANLLGDGSTTASATPVQIPAGSLTGVTQIVAGQAFTCALLTGQTVKCWGSNNVGQLGDGTTTQKTSPVAVTGLTSVTHLQAGNHVVCAKTSIVGSELKCWGNNAQKQLGNGTLINASLPTVFNAFNPALISKYSLNNLGGCALLTDESLRCWGMGNLFGDGKNYHLPNPTPINPAYLSGVSQVSLSTSNGCVLTTVGTVQCWGQNIFGQLGLGDMQDRELPTTVPALTGVTQLVMGTSHVCALLSDETVKCWGYNGWGNLGDGTTLQRNSPTLIPTGTLSGVKKLAAGRDHTCAALDNGTVKCWGQNTYGKLGDGTTTARNVPTLVPTIDLSGVTDVTATSESTCAVLTDTTVKCWGYNFYGQLGDGTTVNKLTATQIPGASLTGVLKLTASMYSICAMLSDTTVKCWGEGTYGQLGNGSTASRSTPTLATYYAGAIDIGMSSYHSCALFSAGGGTVKCAGLANNGGLGNGFTTWGNLYVSTPKPVFGFTGGAKLWSHSVIGNASCVIRSDDEVTCWGDHSSLQFPAPANTYGVISGF